MSGSLRKWWSEDRPIYVHWRWRCGWRGDGWNGLFLGFVTIWFGSGPSPRARLRRQRARFRYWVATGIALPDWVFRLLPGRVLSFVASWAYDDPRAWRKEFGDV